MLRPGRTDRGPFILPPQRCVLLLAAMLAGCRGSEFIPLPELPDQVEFVAAYTADERGLVLSATPLISVHASPLRLELETGADEGSSLVRVLGYSSSDLDRVGGPPPEAGLEAPLSGVRGCESPLPSPSFSRWLADEPPPDVPLTAAWLQGRCPSVLPERPLLVDASCAQPFCDQKVEVRGCELVLDLPRCGLSNLRGSILADGRVCIDQPEDLCQMLEPRDLETSFVLCERSTDSCRLRILPAAPARFVHETFTVYPGAPFMFSDRGPLPATFAETYFGYVSDLEVWDDQVLLLGHGGEWLVHGSGSPPERSELRYHLRSDFALVRTATVPGAGLRLDRHEASGRLLLITRLADGFYLIELDQDGRELRRVLLRANVPGLSTGASLLGGSVLEARSQFVVLIDEVPPEAVDELIVVDLERFQVDRRIDPRAAPSYGRPRVARLLGPDTLVYSDLALNAVVFVDLDSGEKEFVELIPSEFLGLNSYPMGLLALPERDLVLQTIAGTVSSVRVYSRSAFVAQARQFEVRADMAALEVVPGQPQLALAAMETGVEGDRTASLSLFDLERFEFIPGRREVGLGPAGRIRADPDGSLWVLLPWSGQVVRVDFPED